MPRDGSRTRQLLLDTAQRLVELNGFAGTSVDQILEASGSSKGAFFHHFPSKRNLADALVARYVEADLGMLAAGLEAATEVEDPIDRVLVFLGFYEQWSEQLLAEDTNCLYIAVLTERDLLDETTASEVRRAIVGWREPMTDLLRRAFEAAGVVDGPDPGDLADHLFVTFEGSFLLCRSLGTPEPMRQQLRVFRQLIASLLGRDL